MAADDEGQSNTYLDLYPFCRTCEAPVQTGNVLLKVAVSHRVALSDIVEVLDVHCSRSAYNQT